MSDGAATERMLLTGIGELVTNDPAPDRDGGPLGILRDAAVLVEDGRIAWIGPATHATEHLARRDEREDRREAEEHRGIWDADIEVVDVGGRAMIPGFVDSHTHLVFGGDRAEEFAARMAGRRYEAGGIRSTVAATRAATDDELRARLAGFVAELHAQGTTTFEVKSGYGLSVADEERLVRLAREVTDEVTFLGAHVVPFEFREDPAFADDPDRAADAYVDLVVGDDARRLRTVLALGRRVLRARRVHPRAVPPRPRGRRGRGPRRARARQPARRGRRRAPRGRARRGIRRPLHLPQRRGCRRARGIRHRRDAAAGRRVLDPPALPRRAPAHRRGRHRGARERLQPRVELHELDAVLHRRRGARHGHDARPRPCGRRPRAGPLALRRTDVGTIRSGAAADLVLLDAPSHVHLAYRPGVPLVARTWKDGSAVG